MKESGWYYKQLNKEHQQVYYLMKQGITNLAPSFFVQRLTNSELYEIWEKMKMDNPELFWVRTFTYRYYQNSETVEIKPDYLYKKKQIIEHQQAIESRIEKLIRPAQSMDDFGKEQFVHDFICTSVRYDKLKKDYSHEIIGPLVQGVSVCEGIAKTVKVLLDRLNVWCIIAICGNNPEKGIKYRHTWNVININSQMYHLDATFDNSLGKSQIIRYDYYNLCDQHIFRDHEPVIYPIPNCIEAKQSWYHRNKLVLTKMEDVEKRIQQALKKKKPLLFKWNGSYLTKTVLMEIYEKLARLSAEKSKYARVSVNWPQAVIYVEFLTEEKEAVIIEEEVNNEEFES